MKTLLQINSVVNSGSTGRIAEDIGRIAMGKGWKSYIAYARNERPSQSQLIKIGSDWDIKMHGLQTRLMDNHGFASNRATHKFIEEVERIKPTIVHLHNIHGYYINIEILFNYLAKADIPVVWTLHDCWAFTGHCCHFTFIGCDKWKTHCYECPQKMSYPASYLIDNSRDNFTRKRELFNSVKNMTIVPVSNWLGGLVGESFLKKYPKKVIHNGVDLDTFKPMNMESIAKKYNTQNKFVLLGVANIWGQRKGLQDFLELSNHLNNDEVIVLVGLSKEQTKDLPSNIIGLERTESVQELAELYSLADVFINPTYEDNFPTTNIESLACGTPVVTYKTGGSPEAIDANTGFVINQGDIDGLIKVVAEIKSKGKNYYVDACVDRARRMYDKEDRFEEYINLYEQLIYK
jgi:putative colanic acid biosynthesis glycosyltransferase